MPYLTIADIDECTAATPNCHSKANCSNTLGSFVCACFQGYSGDGVNCTGEMVFSKLTLSLMHVCRALLQGIYTLRRPRLIQLCKYCACRYCRNCIQQHSVKRSFVKVPKILLLNNC